tara:strand:+ start:1117 stop:1287 length:171 start_codon:yes stop_codon:yes gene_type:complete
MLNNDDINDLSIIIVNEFINSGLCTDCTDTDDETEFFYQDIIRDKIKEYIKNKIDY